MKHENVAYALSLPEPPPHSLMRLEARLAFLEGCTQRTRKIHDPIACLRDVRGHLNPAGLGNAAKFSQQGSLGQSSVGFDTLEAYTLADGGGRSHDYGGAEYGIVLTPEADAVCRKLTALHKGRGAVICPSGLSAITTTLNAFKPGVVLIPDNVYYPVVRYLQHRKITHLRYPADAATAELSPLLENALARTKPEDIMLYIEAPGCGTFEIPDIEGLAQLAKSNGVRSVMDNTYASHVRFRPLDYMIDIAIQATTKYEGGYGDTPSGVVIAGTTEDLERLRYELRVSGNGTVAPTTCARLFHRIDSVEIRMDQHYNTALILMDWFSRQSFVSKILSPAVKTSPDHARFKRYFGKGNGLFSVVFQDKVPADLIEAFIDFMNLFRVGESWGGHVSLVLPVTARRELSILPKGTIIRFHAGLEDSSDLLRDLEQASARAFGV